MVLPDRRRFKERGDLLELIKCEAICIGGHQNVSADFFYLLCDQSVGVIGIFLQLRIEFVRSFLLPRFRDIGFEFGSPVGYQLLGCAAGAAGAAVAFAAGAVLVVTASWAVAFLSVIAISFFL